MKEKQKRIDELTVLLIKASEAYYNGDTEIMSNLEYDALYDELVKLETETGYIRPDSPTQSAGVEAVSDLVKVTHEYPALSLDKTKDREELKAWLGNNEGVLSWKMDGLTIVATYNKGKLIQAVTRGNGFVGEDVTHNAKYFSGLPNKISYTGKLIVRGEAVMKYDDFEKINASLPDDTKKYKNPRNLASATVRLLDASESIKRPIFFYAFDLVYMDSYSVIDENRSKSSLKSKQFSWLKDEGFNVVHHVCVNSENLLKNIEIFEGSIKTNEFPSDGLVLLYDDEIYGKSLGNTGRYPRNGKAFKWKDEQVETTITGIEWSPSRTGLLNPVAVFKPVEIEGTTVSRASVHNVSIAESLKLGIGSKVLVYKANLIIPQISETTVSTGPTEIPDKCPVCSGKTSVKDNEGIKTLYCDNPMCPAKHIGIFSHFVERDAMNIDGLSSATLERFIENGWITEFADIYHLDKHRKEIVLMEGMGEKSYENLIKAIEKSRKCKFSAFLNSLGIPGVGRDMSKTISKTFGSNVFEEFMKIVDSGCDFSFIEGVGSVICQNISGWFKENKDIFRHLLEELEISPDEVASNNSFISGKTFVITGSLSHYANRDELKNEIEKNGGKVAGSVSSKTDFLINNDKFSQSSKNKKAHELGIEIISEEEFINKK